MEKYTITYDQIIQFYLRYCHPNLKYEPNRKINYINNTTMHNHKTKMQVRPFLSKHSPNNIGHDI